MKIYCLVSLFSLFNISCQKNTNNDKDCKIDTKFQYIYKQSLKAIEESVILDDRKKSKFNDTQSFMFMKILTEHTSRRSTNHFGIFYLNQEDYLKDMDVWQSWYEKNKCHYTYEKLDSLYQIRAKRKQPIDLILYDDWESFLMKKRKK